MKSLSDELFCVINHHNKFQKVKILDRTQFYQNKIIQAINNNKYLTDQILKNLITHLWKLDYRRNQMKK